MEKLFFGILMIVCFNAGASQKITTPIMTTGADAVQVWCGSSEISEQTDVTCILKNGSVSVDNVQAHVLILENEERRNVDDRFVITGIGSHIEAENTYKLLVRLIDDDGLHENQRFVIAITIGNRIIELPLQLSSKNK
jgi:hypothetical protein